MASYIVLWNDDEEDWVSAEDAEAGKSAAARVLRARGCSPETLFQLVPIPQGAGGSSPVGGSDTWFRVEDHLEKASSGPTD